MKYYIFFVLLGFVFAEDIDCHNSCQNIVQHSQYIDCISSCYSSLNKNNAYESYSVNNFDDVNIIMKAITKFEKISQYPIICRLYGEIFFKYEANEIYRLFLNSLQFWVQNDCKNFDYDWIKKAQDSPLLMKALRDFVKI